MTLIEGSTLTFGETGR